MPEALRNSGGDERTRRAARKRCKSRIRRGFRPMDAAFQMPGALAPGVLPSPALPTKCSTLATVIVVLLLILSTSRSAASQEPAADANAQNTSPAQGASGTVVCSSKPGERSSCAADTSKGVVLLRSTGDAPCLLGKTWGYDQASVWVADGCSADFATGAGTAPPDTTAKPKPLSYMPNVGFLLFDGEKGQVYFRLMSYGRYLNQRNLDEQYTDAFGNTKTVQRRQDVQLQKFFAPFSGWFLTPKMRYYLYVWSSNPSQGDPAQVVGAGNLTWGFNRHVNVGIGITSLPTVRSTEGQFPYWLGVDDRLIADEFFRGSYTSGVWVKGEINTKVKYNVMFGNNLSTLGVSAAQLDNRFDTQSYSLQWLPTTGEFGLWNTFGDYDHHQTLATRIGVHYTHSLEEKQSQPGTEGIENSQIRLTDGSVIFTPDLFGPGITVNEVDYRMTSIDAAAKYKGMSLEGEYYVRWLSHFTGANTSGI